MWCRCCQSQHLALYRVEMCIHPKGGMESLTKPVALAFPSVLFCLDCGFAEFTLAQDDLLELKKRSSDNNPAA